MPVRPRLRSNRLGARVDGVLDRAADRVARRVAERIESSDGSPAEASPEAHAVDRERRDNEHLELLLGFLLHERSNCIDVGANEGRFLFEMTRRAPLGRHLAWEPIPHLAEALRRDHPDVEVHQAAVTDRGGEAEFVLVPEDTGYSGLRERAYPREWATERITVPLERLDDAVPVGYVPDLIKVDVEGAEREAFEGALEILVRHRPVVVFEHGMGAADRYGTTPEHVHDLLVGQAGLRIFDMDADGPFSRERFAEIFASGRRWNFLARP